MCEKTGDGLTNKKEGVGLNGCCFVDEAKSTPNTNCSYNSPFHVGFVCHKQCRGAASERSLGLG